MSLSQPLTRVEQFSAKAREYAEVKDKLTSAEDLLRRTTDDVARLRDHLANRAKDLKSMLGANLQSRFAMLPDGKVLVAEYLNVDGPPKITIYSTEGEPCR